MIHGFTEEQWDGYIEGQLDEETRDRIEAHLIGCLSCWEFHERMATARSPFPRHTPVRITSTTPPA